MYVGRNIGADIPVEECGAFLKFVVVVFQNIYLIKAEPGIRYIIGS